MDINNPVLIKVSGSLGIPPEWLYKIIKFESNWNPKATARYPYNKEKSDNGTEAPKFARGLLQFIDSTAIDLGYTSADNLVERNPTINDQLLFPVLQYLTKFKPFTSEQSFYLSVFYPTARNWQPSQLFPASVRAANPGINCPADYLNKVKGVQKINVFIIGVIGAGLFLMSRYLK